ncbi:uncharacterized protein LOC141912462 [Tubulanus polymorphus]|uniref:uncharacterized protein LOC141912462 n=1 Tax=Tubulanus polymorphus TaxID=672921 RepID=UPI003DA2EF86
MASQMSPVYSAGGAGHVKMISPQPQTVVNKSAVPQQLVATSNRRADGSRIGFADRSVGYCGHIQIVCGFILILNWILMMRSSAMFAKISYGFWGSILCFVAGGLCVLGAKLKNNCLIIGAMVVSIFTCLFGFVLVGFSVAGIPIDEQQRRCLEESVQMKFNPPTCDTAMPARSISQVNFRIACHVGNILVGIVLMVVPIVQSCFSCRAICCPRSDAYILQQPIVYMKQQPTTHPGQIAYGQHLQVYGQPTANQPPGYGQPAATTQVPGIHGLPSYNEAITEVKSVGSRCLQLIKTRGVVMVVS